MEAGVRDISLLEIIWKIILIIIKVCILDNGNFYDTLHRLLPRQGNTTAIIEAKLHQDTNIAANNTTYQVFIDLAKTYDSVSRKKLLAILLRRGVGPNIIARLANQRLESRVKSGWHPNNRDSLFCQSNQK
jgi:hypothetical protein